jgi:VCBS repeat-containing protein
MVVTWQPGVTQTFTINVLEGSTLHAPIVGTIERDPGNTGDVVGGTPLVVNVVDDTVTFSGEIAWYPADEDLGRTAGNRVGVEINAPEGYDTSTTTFTVFGSTYTWDDVNDGDNFVWIYPKVTEVPQSWDIVVTWQPGVTQTFTVEVLEGSTLDVLPTVVSGIAIGATGFDDVTAVDLTFTVDQGYTVDHIEFTMSEDVIVAADTVVSIGEVPYGTITSDGDILTVTPYPGNEVAAMLGEFTFSIPVGSVTNLAGNPLETLFATLIVNNVPPVAVDDTYSVAEDGVLTVAARGVLSNDTDFDPTILTAVKVTDPANGTLTLNADGGFTYTPAANFNGTDTFTYKANDGLTDSNVATVTITVTEEKDQVEAVDDAYQTDEDTPLTIDAPGVLSNDIDVDLNIMTAGLVTDVEHGTLTLNADGSFVYVPEPDFNGTDSFVYQLVTYPAVQSLWTDEATVTITVHPINDAPIAEDQSVTTPEETAKAITLVATDIENDPLTYAIVAQPAHGTVVLVDNVATYTPALNYTGPDSFTFKANDGMLDSNVATVSITVTPVNDAPVAVDDEYTVAEKDTLTIVAPGVLANDVDVDGDALTAILVDDVSDGTLTLNADGSFTYTPDEYFNGTDSFTYLASDGTLESELAEVVITVTPVNDWPIANDDFYETITGVLLDVAAPGVLENDVLLDPDEEVSIQILDAPQHGTLSMNDDGSFTYTPDTGFMGTDTFRYQVNSVQINAEWSDDALVTIVVKPYMHLFLPIIWR